MKKYWWVVALVIVVAYLWWESIGAALGVGSAASGPLSATGNGGQ